MEGELTREGGEGEGEEEAFLPMEGVEGEEGVACSHRGDEAVEDACSTSLRTESWRARGFAFLVKLVDMTVNSADPLILL